jgi:hypothetical protein
VLRRGARPADVDEPSAHQHADYLDIILLDSPKGKASRQRDVRWSFGLTMPRCRMGLPLTFQLRWLPSVEAGNDRRRGNRPEIEIA